MINITTVPRTGAECFNEAEVVVFKGTQGVVFTSAVGIGLFVDRRGYDVLQSQCTN